MFSPDETPGRRRNWGAVYAVLSLMGLSVLIPPLSPTSLGIGPGLTFAWGLLMLVGWGVSAFSAFYGRRLLWMENSGSWLGNAGLSIYVITLIQSVLVDGSLGKTPQTIGYVALLLIMVSRSFRLQRYLKTVRRLKEIVRIAHRNDNVV